jgi:hypothetical protein
VAPPPTPRALRCRAASGPGGRRRKRQARSSPFAAASKSAWAATKSLNAIKLLAAPLLEFCARRTQFLLVIPSQQLTWTRTPMGIDDFPDVSFRRDFGFE